ncbi:putative damage-inducible protein DinB [Paenibacillus phyllosphaerae]|uniref:Putative damage-inducible protein DinB n=1 Tax=Paenibacillus phyllosphaerae TaxID=274593 RepID=A0A7W5FM75_9BACL|nr:DinB family protein [Paenibacillus phyllosphaerae]MBB3109709.1 putative damage-inducible protein DinB [Paenibacillus phyllosphaerae]
MNFKLDETIAILSRTPRMLDSLLAGLSDEWLTCNEGEGTWNARQVLAHLIDGERTNWLPRLMFLIQEGTRQPFPPFDRYAHLNGAVEGEEPTLADQLHLFRELRDLNITKLKELVQEESQLELTGLHPAFGEVRLRELLATWVVHDLAHTAQITRVMAERYREDVGPWIAYLGILNKK